jgi:general secretion pathway protein A
LICDRALLGGYVHATRTITRPLVAEAGRELRGATGPRYPRRAWALGGGAAVLLALGGLWAFPGLMSDPAGADAPSSTLAFDAQPLVAASSAPSLSAAAAPATAKDLDATLRSPGSGSLAGALEEIRPLWGPGPLEEARFRAHMMQLRRLDLPVVLEMFHPLRRDTAYLALLRLDGDVAIVATAAGVQVPVRVSELDRHWTRWVWAVWRDFDGVLRHPDRSWAASWIGATLARRGYAVGPAGLAETVARFQAERDLAPDGIVGSRTLMTLYSTGDYARPRLTKGAS